MASPDREKAPSPQRAFAPGFRFSVMDAVVIATGIVLAMDGPAFVPALPATAWVIGITTPVLAFFLFCNVFRVRRSRELLWAGLYVVLAASTVQTGMPGWVATAVIAAVALMAIIFFEMRSHSYHGIGWQRVNPKLPDWWASQQAQ